MQNTKNKLPVSFLLLIFIFASVVSAYTYSDCSVYGNCGTIKTTASINYSLIPTVNNSLYWQGHTGTDGSWLTGIDKYNSTYDTHVNNLTIHNSTFLYNQTLATYNLWNAVWLSTYNETYAGLINNASYLSTYNSTYDAKISFNNTNLVYKNNSEIITGTLWTMGNLTLTNLTASKMVLTNAAKQLVSGVTFPATTAAGCLPIGTTANTITTVCSTTGTKVPVSTTGTMALTTVTGIGAPVLATSPTLTAPVFYTVTAGDSVFSVSTEGLIVPDMYYRDSYTTVDATPTVLQTLVPPTYGVTMYEAKVVAVNRADFSEGAGYVIRATYSNSAGNNAVLIGAIEASYTAEKTAAWNANFTNSSGTVRVTVTGEAGHAIDWQSTVTTISVMGTIP